MRRPAPEGPRPEFGLYLAAREPMPQPWPSRWVRWPDLRLPTDPQDADSALRQAWELSEHQRVEVACGGGRGRTGTALARLSVLDGVSPRDAVAYVREHYDRRAVETPWQKRYVARSSER